ncbi:restriction endonuclease [Embleya hyalina]|uniref:Restriction endonuclease n=1 Tax=Embleya hyalina TaxID=516124 RepID=A0A401YYF7_9ACTN|nr:restriction endonuclease [Embleya hyalina]GCD99647.1 restriction endonuclease [Embleya hyalina]
MIIDSKAAVVPPRYENRDLRTWMGDRIGKAAPDDLIAAWLLVSESAFVRAIHGHLDQHVARLRHEHSEILRRLEHDGTDGDGTSFTQQWRATSRAWARLLETELRAARTRTDEARHVWSRLTEDFGVDPVSLFDGATPRSGATAVVEEGPALYQAYERAERRLARRRTEYHDAMHELALAEDLRMTRVHKGEVVALADIDRMSHHEFEHLAAVLMRRDGYRVERAGGGPGDLGADIVATDPDGRIVVIQCKHTRRQASVGSPELQRLNGTARPVHGAETVIALTNGSFSRPAVAFARNQHIHLMPRDELRRWASHGEPLDTILGRK